LSLDHPKQTANGDNAPVEKYNLQWKSRGSKWSLRAVKAAKSPKGDKAPRITLAESTEKPNWVKNALSPVRNPIHGRPSDENP
jgi:hypothetical protein